MANDVLVERMAEIKEVQDKIAAISFEEGQTQLEDLSASVADLSTTLERLIGNFSEFIAWSQLKHSEFVDSIEQLDERVASVEEPETVLTEEDAEYIGGYVKSCVDSFELQMKKLEDMPAFKRDKSLKDLSEALEKMAQEGHAILEFIEEHTVSDDDEDDDGDEAN